MLETIQKTCATVSFVSYGFLTAMLFAEMVGPAFNPIILFSGMAIFYLASLKYV